MSIMKGFLNIESCNLVLSTHYRIVDIIGDNTILIAGTKIVSSIIVRKNCVIEVNAVVTKDIPDNCLAIGVSAKIFKENINIEEYK